MSVLVLGESGQLASHLRQELPNAVCWGRRKLDLASDCAIARAIIEFKPSLVVNAAGFTAVDRAESERRLAWTLNAAAPAAMAEAAAALEVPLIHVSTDYVFDGRKDSEYETDDAVRPISVYGATKLAGELAGTTLCEKHWILRTSWVFSGLGQNFVRTMLKLASSRPSLRVVADQIGRPTYAGDIARAIARIAERYENGKPLPFGLYHATGGPIVSWHQFAEEIVERAVAAGVLDNGAPIIPITTEEYPTAALRPKNSALRPSEEISRAMGAPFDWQRGLDQVLKAMAVPDPRP